VEMITQFSLEAIKISSAQMAHDRLSHPLHIGIIARQNFLLVLSNNLVIVARLSDVFFWKWSNK
jgi:hypothetical protein